MCTREYALSLIVKFLSALLFFTNNNKINYVIPQECSVPYYLS